MDFHASAVLVAGARGHKITNHRIDKLDSIVIRRVVAGSNHNTNPLPIEFPRTETSNEAYREDHGVEEAAVRGRGVQVRNDERGAECAGGRYSRFHAKL